MNTRAYRAGETATLKAVLARVGALLLLAALVVGAAACQTIPPDLREPGVRLQSITPRASGGGLPAFEILLEVSNPNRVALEAEGMTYSLSLQDYRVIDGVAADLPRIPAYETREVRILARANLFGGLGLLNELLAAPAEPIRYRFDAEIDVGTLYPMLRVRREGVVTLR